MCVCVCVCVCGVRACVRACMRACVCARLDPVRISTKPSEYIRILSGIVLHILGNS